MYHSITFGEKNTWDDWHLIPKKRPRFSPPDVQTSFLKIPWSSVTLDFSTVLSDQPAYNNREGSFEFYVENGFKPWAVLYSELMAFFHGKQLRAVLEDDPNYYYEGRFYVNDWKSDAQRSTVVIDYIVGPFKKSLASSDDEWLWDSFNFYSGVIRCYKNLPVNGTTSVTIIGCSVNVSPTIIASDSMTMEYMGSTFALTAGRNTPDITIQNGEHVMMFNGSGTVTIQFREEAL